MPVNVLVSFYLPQPAMVALPNKFTDRPWPDGTRVDGVPPDNGAEFTADCGDEEWNNPPITPEMIGTQFWPPVGNGQPGDTFEDFISGWMDQMNTVVGQEIGAGQFTQNWDQSFLDPESPQCSTTSRETANTNFSVYGTVDGTGAYRTQFVPSIMGFYSPDGNIWRYVATYENGNFVVSEDTNLGLPWDENIPAIESLIGATIDPTIKNVYSVEIARVLELVECPAIPVSGHPDGQYPFSSGTFVFEMVSGDAEYPGYSRVVFQVAENVPPPQTIPPLSFSFPTGAEQDALFMRWSRPPLETRIPFQNYSFPVPRIVFRTEK